MQLKKPRRKAIGDFFMILFMIGVFSLCVISLLYYLYISPMWFKTHLVAAVLGGLLVVFFTE